MDEMEVSEILRDILEGDILNDSFVGAYLAFVGAYLDNTPSENAGFYLTLVDGTKFLVSVTKIEEGE